MFTSSSDDKPKLEPLDVAENSEESASTTAQGAGSRGEQQLQGPQTGTEGSGFDEDLSDLDDIDFDEEEPADAAGVSDDDKTGGSAQDSTADPSSQQGIDQDTSQTGTEQQTAMPEDSVEQQSITAEDSAEQPLSDADDTGDEEDEEASIDPSQFEASSLEETDDGSADDLDLDLNLKEFLPDDEEIDIEQYKEAVKQEAQKGAKKQLEKNADQLRDGDIDLEGLREDLSQGDNGDEGTDEEASDTADSGQTTTESAEQPGSSDSVERPSPPTRQHGSIAHKYNASDDSLYILKGPCQDAAEAFADIKRDVLTEKQELQRISEKDMDAVAADADNIVSTIQDELLSLEESLFEEE